MRIKGRTKILLCTCNNYHEKFPEKYEHQTWPVLLWPTDHKKQKRSLYSHIWFIFVFFWPAPSQGQNTCTGYECKKLPRWGKGGGGQGVRCQMHVLHVPLVSFKDCKIVEDTENKWVFPPLVKIQKLYNMRMKVSEDYWKLIIK